jgi:hypothetical protein
LQRASLLGEQAGRPHGRRHRRRVRVAGDPFGFAIVSRAASVPRRLVRREGETRRCGPHLLLELHEVFEGGGVQAPNLDAFERLATTNKPGS